MAQTVTPNPFLDLEELPRFTSIQAKHVTTALDVLLESANDAVLHASLPQTPNTWEAVFKSVEAATEPLSRVWGLICHLNSVADTPALRAAHAKNLPRVTEFWANLGQNIVLYEKYKAIVDGSEYAQLSNIRKRILENVLRTFRLSGVELLEHRKSRFIELRKQQAELSKAFSDHVLDATNAYAYFVTDNSQLSGLPEDVIVAAKQAAQKDGKPGWKFTLHFPSYFPVLQYAEYRPIREAMYYASMTRASELWPDCYGSGKLRWDNTVNMIKQLKLRAEEAVMLGYQNFAQVSLEPKMADSPEQVTAFLDNLALHARPYAEKEWAQLQAFASDELRLKKLEASDITYASEKLRQKHYAFSEREVKQYFPETSVLQGLFRITEALFHVLIKPSEAEKWHPDTQFFRVENHDGTLLAQFYLDLHARDGKHSGAWMDTGRSRYRRSDGTLQTPIAYLMCNFSAPLSGKPSCLTHDEVIILFHEFGHGLHHMLTQIDELGASGANGVEWDAVELPSQLMENFCWEWDVLTGMTSHVDTKEPLPYQLFRKMLAARNFQSGLTTLHQIVLSRFDMLLHTTYDPNGELSISMLAQQVNDSWHVVPQAPFSRWPNMFNHVFSGGYAAGYYSYKWAEVLSADAYAAFEEAASARGSAIDPETGARYRAQILEVGGSRSAIDSFKAFRGRAPRIDALLRLNGMNK
ncbi:M3 family metallopeptidase [Candidatus Vallotiella sp. (ex Adelges kitamiensis)]|uniref:M3 family metallopeptidase n=1 Tax=Candidatus Vallotiella sp. (ex Adelges kitamiensis) TaxID=2864217 RepID=UPI001CE353B8|nr:M3 family metallopeptidase [Candidatus Vallotia sp. (ex Adelges kitamiensis)]